MHKIIPLILIFVFAACSMPRYIPCVNEFGTAANDTRLMPINNGNKWVYKEMTYDNKGNPEDSSIRTIEIGPLDTIMYQGPEDKHPLEAYPIVVNKMRSKQFFYVKCAEGAVYSSTYNPDSDVLYTGYTIPDDISPGWKDPRDPDAEWEGPVEINVPAGTFECWHRDNEARGGNVRREYYAMNIGLVKVEIYYKNRFLRAEMELDSYELAGKI